jgi:DNA-binding response OmpR family regulator
MNNRPAKILYIEDQPEMIDLVNLALRQLKCEVIGATGGLEGLRLMREQRPDLVLLDLMLPEPDGWQVRKVMLADAALRDLPVILVTARVQLTEAVDTRPLPPADGCIIKPFSLAEMRAMVQAILQKRTG